MASFDLSEDQSAALHNVHIGDLVLVQQFRPSPDSEDEQDSDSDLDSEDDEEDEEESDPEHSDSGADGSTSASDDDGSETASPRATGTELSTHTTNTSNADHAEHVEDVNGSSASNNQHTTQDSQQFPSLFLVTSVTKDSNDVVKDLGMMAVQYSDQPDAHNLSFQIYGNQCVANLPQVPGLTVAANFERLDQESISIRDILSNSDLTFTASPDGDLIRSTVFDDDCPASCRNGWLHCIHDLQGMVRNYTIPSTSTEEQPVCPSCVGIDLMQEHQNLRAELEAFHRVTDFGAIFEFYSRLASRRRELGYEFVQFDERRWGYLFDDMLSEDGDNGGNDDGQYEVWDEATDPSNGAIFRPTSEGTIKALPVVNYADVKEEEGASCTICCEIFKNEQTVMLLPCKHFFCADGCLEQWLRQSDNCPNCRAKIEDVGSKAHDSGNEDGDNGVDEAGAQKDEDGGGEVDNDGDVAMADAVVGW